MGEVICFDERIIQSRIPDLATQLQTEGSILVREMDAGVHPVTWRRAVRAAAKSLGRKVRTYHVDHVLFAELTDWPRDANEQAVVDRRMREAADLMNAFWDDLLRRTPTPLRPNG